MTKKAHDIISDKKCGHAIKLKRRPEGGFRGLPFAGGFASASWMWQIMFASSATAIPSTLYSARHNGLHNGVYLFVSFARHRKTTMPTPNTVSKPLHASGGKRYQHQQCVCAHERARARERARERQKETPAHQKQRNV